MKKNNEFFDEILNENDVSGMVLAAAYISPIIGMIIGQKLAGVPNLIDVLISGRANKKFAKLVAKTIDENMDEIQGLSAKAAAKVIEQIIFEEHPEYAKKYKSRINDYDYNETLYSAAAEKNGVGRRSDPEALKNARNRYNIGV